MDMDGNFIKDTIIKHDDVPSPLDETTIIKAYEALGSGAPYNFKSILAPKALWLSNT